MNGTMKKRIVAGLLALGMVFSPTGAGIASIPSFAENDVSVNADDSTGGDENTEDGESDSDDGETDPNGGDTDPDGEENSDNGEADPEEEKTSEEDGASEEENVSDDESVDDFIGTTQVFEKYGNDVLPYNIVTDDRVIELADELDISNNWSVDSYDPTIYASVEGYNGLNAKQKKAYETLYAGALRIDNSDEDYGTKGVINYTDGSKPIYYFGKNNSKDPDYAYVEDLEGYIFFDPGISIDDIWLAYNAMAYDNPQLFWLGHSMRYFTFKDAKGSAVVIGTESVDYSDGTKRQEAKTKLYNKIDEIVDGAAVYANGYSVEWYIHDYLCKNTIYDPDLGNANESQFDHDVTGLLLHGVCVCESYAKTTQLLINAVTEEYDFGDLDVRYVVGMAYSYYNGKYYMSGGHAWNQILLDGKWYNYDATWDDIAPEYQEYYKGAEYTYEFFNVTDKPFTSEHHAFEYYEKMYSTSKCTATEYSYENHNYNFALEADIRYTVSVGGKVVYKATSVEAALHYINKVKNTKADYVISYIPEEDVVLCETISNVTLGNANSITFAGDLSYMTKGSFTANCDVIFESLVTLDGKITSSKSIYIRNNANINKDAEIDIKSLVLDGKDSVVIDRDGAKSVKIANLISDTESRNSVYWSSPVSIGTVTVTGNFNMYVAKTADVEITGKVTCNGGTKVNLAPFELDYTYDTTGKPVSNALANGTTLIKAKTAPAASFRSEYLVNGEEIDEYVTYALYKDGDEVKATLPRVSVYTDTLYGAYATFDEAVAAVNADKALVGKNIVISLSDNVETAKMALPTKSGNVFVTSDGDNEYKIVVTGANAVTFPTDTALGRVSISTKSVSGLTISASKNVSIYGASFDNLTAIKGTAKGSISFSDHFGPCAVTGFGEMYVGNNFECGTINVGTLTLYGGTLNVKSDSSVTVKNIYGDDNAAIVYAPKAKLVNVTGTAQGSVKISTTEIEGFMDGDKVLTAKTADMSVFKLDPEKLRVDGFDYTLTRTGSDLCVAKVVLKAVSSADEGNVLKFAKWADFVSMVEARKDSKAEYTVTLLDTVNVGGALKMPKAGTYGKLTITGNKDLIFTGNITLTGNTVFDDISLISVKGKTGVAYNIAAGKYLLQMYRILPTPDVHTISGVVESYTDNAGPANITSSGDVVIDCSSVRGNVTANNLTVSETDIKGSVTASNIIVGIEEAVTDELSSSVDASNSFVSTDLEATRVCVDGNLTAKTLLTLHSSLAVKGTFSAVGIEADNENYSDVMLYLFVGKKPAEIGKTGFTKNSTNLDLALLGSDGKTVELKTVTVIANIKGKYADHFTPINANIDTDEQEVGYYIVKSGTQLVAKPRNTSGLIKVSVNGKIGYYPSYDSIIKDITTVADPEAEYVIYFGEKTELSKITLPGAKKYGKLTFDTEEKAATITTNGDLNLTGSFTLASNVTINKVDKDGKIVDMNVNAGAYEFDCAGKVSYENEINHFGKLNGAKNSSIKLYGNYEVSTAVSAYDLYLNGVITLGAKAPLTLTGNLTSDTNASVCYPFANAAKIKFGSITKAALKLVSTDNAVLKDGTYLANVTGEVLGGITAASNETNTGAIRSGSKLIAGAYESSLIVMNQNEGAGCYYDTFENAMAGITAANRPDAEYKFYIPKDITVNKFTMPAAKKFASITITSNFSKDITITTASDITLTGSLTIESGVAVKKVKSGKTVPISINTGSSNEYIFTCNTALSNDDAKSAVSNVASITGKGGVYFINGVDISGNVNVGTFNAAGVTTLTTDKVGFTCSTLIPQGGKLVYTEKNAAKVKLGTIESNSYDITFPILGEGKLLANITGDYPAASIKFGMQGETNLDEYYKAVRIGNKIIIRKPSDAVIMNDGKIDRAYSDLTSALNDIARIGNEKGSYTITLSESATLKKLPLPAKGKYKSVKFISTLEETITVSSDITLTGDLIIGKNVTLEKASGKLKITSPKGSGFTATTEDTGKIVGDVIQK